MWEVMSYGERPYWDMTNQDVSVQGGWVGPLWPARWEGKIQNSWPLADLPGNRRESSEILGQGSSQPNVG